MAIRMKEITFTLKEKRENREVNLMHEKRAREDRSTSYMRRTRELEV